jgi:hypothetical protein
VSNYTKSTNFATKDALASGNPLKIVKGTEIDTEFNNIATAVATKADLASPTFTGTPTLPTGTVAVTQSAGNNTTAIATTAFVQAAIALLYPVGSILQMQLLALTLQHCLALVHGLHLVLVVSWLVLMRAMHCLTLLKKLVVVQMQLLSATLTLQHQQILVTYIHKQNTAAGFGNAGGGGALLLVRLKQWQNTGTGFAQYYNNSCSAGSSGTNANYQPYITVYMWKRTA